jgi:hypothetical protein
MILAKFHYTREGVELGDVDLEHIGTNEELADKLMNVLGTKRFHALWEKIGVIRGLTFFPIKGKIPPVSFIQNRVHNLAFITGFTLRRWLNPQSSLILRIKTFTTCLLLITLEAFPLQLRFSGLAYYILYSQINIYGL